MGKPHLPGEDARSAAKRGEDDSGGPWSDARITMARSPDAAPRSLPSSTRCSKLRSWRVSTRQSTYAKRHLPMPVTMFFCHRFRRTQ
jgi:hypothetical protein